MSRAYPSALALSHALLRLLIVVNKTPPVLDATQVRQNVERAYGCEVAAVLPHSDEMMTLASEGVFVSRYPDHPLAELYRQVAATLAPAS